MDQAVRFCQSADGTRIAYKLSGNGSAIVVSPLLYVPLENHSATPFWTDAFHALATRHTVVQFDLRGTGLSQRDIPELRFDDLVADLSAVIDAAGVQSFALLGIAGGSGAAITYAAQHPDRVTHLILFGASARNTMQRGPEGVDVGRALNATIRHGWGTADPTYRVMWVRRVVPDADESILNSVTELERRTASSADAAKLQAVAADMNVIEPLKRIRMPTLVLYPENGVMHPQERSLEIAAHVPHAKVVSIGSSAVQLLNSDVASSEVFVSEVGRLLGDPEVSVPVRGLLNIFRRAYFRCHDFVASAPYKVAYAILALIATAASVVYYIRALL